MISVPADETELLQTINRRLPPEVQQRYDQLCSKILAERITPTEHQELLALTERVEQMNVERVEALVRLAQLWQMSLRDVMDKLDIRPPPARG